MLFKDLKPNYPVYLLDKQQVKANVGKVISVSNPRFQNPVAPPPASPFSPSAVNPQVVDVTIEVDTKQTTYTIPDTLDFTYAGNDLVLSTARDAIIHEVETLKSTHEAELAKLESRRTAIASCDLILTEWNPAFREKRENEARFTAIERGQSEMRAMMQTLIDKLS